MKTQVIQLDPHDDVTSVRDRMSWAKTPRILLVYPPRSRLLARRLDLRLLQFHARELGGQLAIVARRGDIRLDARELGIPVFKKAATAQREPWDTSATPGTPLRRAPRPDLRQMRREVYPGEARWRDLLGVRLAFFSLAVLAVLALLLLFFPSAMVTLVPASRIQSLAIAASASTNVSAVSLTGGLPARLTYTILKKSKTAPVTGSLVTPDTPATGTASFRNLTTVPVGIPTGTVIRSTANPPVRFATTQDAVVPAGVDKKLDVPVQALQAGSSGNLPADSLTTIEGDLGTSLAVTNPAPTTGGADHTAPVQTDVDRLRLRTDLESEALHQCRTSLPQSIHPGDVFLPTTLVVGQVLSETYFPAIGQTSQTLTLTMNLQCQAEYVSASDVNSLARQVLDANLPAGYEPVSIAVTTLNSTPPLTEADGTTHWTMQAQRLMRRRLDPLQAVRLVQGRTPPSAARRLTASLQLAQPPQITLKPAWWPWLPVIPFRITISAGG